MYRLARPNMAINDPRVSLDSYVRRYRMQYTWDVSHNQTASHMIERIALAAQRSQGRKLKNLVLNGHGGPGSVLVGAGFDNSNVALFEHLNGMVEKIWLPNCKVAQGSQGTTFCGAMSRGIGGYVVAPTERQCETVTEQPYDMMTSFEGLVLSFGPSGRITWRGRNPSTYLNGSNACVAVPD